MKELELARNLFLTDVDEETRADNLAVLNEWEASIRENESYEQWKHHDITISINKKLRETYIEDAASLAQNRELTEAKRLALYARQDACLYLLSLTSKDAKADIEVIREEIRQKIDATK